MNASDLIRQLESAGFRLRADCGLLKVSPASRLSPAQRRLIEDNRSGLLEVLDPWDREAAESVAAPAVARQATGRSPDPATRARQLDAAIAIDSAWDKGNMAELRKAVAEYLKVHPEPGVFDLDGEKWRAVKHGGRTSFVAESHLGECLVSHD